ncbi:MAG: endospore germination permease [Oscillospiraceae bacterium]|nr:endospore germination permease [Oscillospiraceae bacterium]
MENKPFIKSFGLFATLISTTIGMNILYFPVSLSKSMNNNGWYITISLTILVYFFSLFLFKLYNKYNFNSIYELFYTCCGKIVSKILFIVLSIFSLIYVGIILNNFSKVIKLYLFPKTPTAFFILTMCILICYGIKNSPRGMVRFNEVAFFIILFPMIIIFSFCINKGDYSNLLPFKFENLENIIGGVKSSLYIFSGIEILYFYLPYLTNKENTNRVLKNSLIFICIFNLILYVLCLFSFGSNQLKILLNPFLTLIRVIDVPGSFLERWEGIVISFWIFYCFTSSVNISFFAKELLCETFHINKNVTIIMILITLSLLGVWDEITSLFTEFYYNSFYVYQISLYLIIPVIFYILLKFKNEKRIMK